MNPTSRPRLLGMVAGFFLAAGLVFYAMLGATAWMKVRNSQFITLKGSARKNIWSDLTIRHDSFTAEVETLLDAQRKLKADFARVDEFPRANQPTNYSFTPITIEAIKATVPDALSSTEQKAVGYRLTQAVRIESYDAVSMPQLVSESTRLVEEGVLFTTRRPRIIHSRAGEAKVEMLAEATKDARTCAEQIAEQGGHSVAQLHDADMDVFQIAPFHSSRSSWEGMNDNSSLEKTITAVVATTFALK